MRKTFVAIAAVSALACASANAAIDIYNAELLGTNEVGVGGGDPDGYGGATVMIDTLTNSVSWMFYVLNIDTPTMGHIHAGAAGVNGPVIIPFNVAGGATAGSVIDADAASINPGNAMSFYVNLHNAAYPGGAVRGQLMYAKTVSPPVPEPETYALLLAGLGVVGWVARRRRVAA
jgi:hypothetical protein